ncbi:MAG: hypothetical protein E7054_09635 [Lentisphaerae bacterium]|nr:hypothetical protein [Lentisphaerota bacterium]
MKRFAILILLLLSLLLSAAAPLLRFGAISDNHLDSRKPDSWARTKMAFEFFKKQQVQFFIDAGDVTDTFQPEMFKLWRQMYQEVFSDAKSRPDFLMIPAGHDKSGAASTAAGYAEFVKLTGSGEVNPVKKINGYHFVSLAQWENIRILKKNLDAAVADSAPGQPVFVITHVPPRSTTHGSGSKASGDEALRKLLNNYPQVIVLSGHNHARLMDERAIWQGEFTAVNLGSLAYYGDGGIANPSDRPKSYDASIWEVYPDKVVVKRYNVQSGRELFPERRWVIPLPFKKESAPYSAAARKKFPVAEFDVSGKIIFKPEFSSPHRWGKLLLPQLKRNSFALLGYRIAVEKKSAAGVFEPYGVISFIRGTMPESGCGDEFTFPAGYLESGSTYKVTATPFSYFGKSKISVSGEFTIGEVPWKEIKSEYTIQWQPWKSTRILTPDENGFVQVNGDLRYLLPGQAFPAALKTKNKLVIVSMDIECIGKGKPAYLRISNNRNQIISPNTGEYRETALKQHYSFIYPVQKKDRSHYLLIRRGSPAGYRITNVRSFIFTSEKQ